MGMLGNNFDETTLEFALIRRTSQRRYSKSQGRNARFPYHSYRTSTMHGIAVSAE